MDDELQLDRNGHTPMVMLMNRPCRPDCGCSELSHALHDLLDAAAAGRLPVTTPQERRLLRRIESALAAFDAGWGILADRARELADTE